MKKKILNLLQTGEQTTSSMSLVLGVPEPSIRRAIQELRRDGYNICFADERNGIYKTV